MTHTLGYFNSGDNQKWFARLEVSPTLGGPSSYSRYYAFQCDNTRPTCDITLTSSAICGDITVGTTVKGKFKAQDLNFGMWILQLLPTNGSHPVQVLSGDSNVTEEAAWEDWQLATTGLEPCGYVVQVVVWDRCIRDSVPSRHFSDHREVGFCLRPAAGISWEVIEE